jgi:galactonate dehydratase
MKITDVKSFPVWVGFRNQMVIKVETDAGIYGLGEAGLSYRELAVAGAVKHYREWLIGRDPMNAGALWQEMYRSQYFEGGRVLTAAQSAIDIALYDIKGKALGVPVYQLLGGKHRDAIPGFCTATVATGPDLLDNVRAFLNYGWKVIRFGPDFQRQPGDTDPNLFEPSESIGYTAEWLTKVREAVGPGPIFGIDYHHRLSVAETASFSQRMPPGTLDFLEEPIRDESPEAYAALRTMVSIPFAIGEEISSKWGFLPYIERGLTNYARIDICNVGGFTEAMKVAGWAEAHYIDLMPHNPLGPICTAATIQMSAAVPNFSWLEMRVSPSGETFNFDDELFPVSPKMVGTSFPVLDTPGLGVDFNEALAASRPFRFSEAPHLHKRDGSHTNW